MSHSLYRPPTPEQIPRLAYRPREAAVALGLSLASVERLIRAGEIATVRAGRCRLIRVEAIREYLERLESSATTEIGGAT